MSQYLIFADDGRFTPDNWGSIEKHLHEFAMYSATPENIEESDDLAEALDLAREVNADRHCRVIVLDREKWTNGDWKGQKVYELEAPTREVELRVKFTLSRHEVDLIRDAQKLFGQDIDNLADALVEIMLNPPGGDAPLAYGIEVKSYEMEG